MTDIFVIRNQLGHYWGKGKHWVDGSEPKTVMKLKHRDEAINTLFELSSKDIELRGEILEAELNSRGEPRVVPSEIPLPEAPDTEADETESAAAEDQPDNEMEDATSPAETETAASNQA